MQQRHGVHTTIGRGCCALLAFTVAWWLPQVRQFGPETLWLLETVLHRLRRLS